ncbi:uncharacterized protein LOC124286565 [Haliotis rubra]|uniref:uncharacterized protein LOC124286565 n=1 Tax=Haliotis rubra TaxID=36100 RepID=UPI001EE5F524|nr:uncharacterized protein LOC124286565 [Haliotis rubra]
MFSDSASSISAPSSSRPGSRPLFGKKVDEVPSPQNHPTTVDEPMFYPEPRSSQAEVGPQKNRRRQTNYMIPSPLDYSVSTRLTTRRAPSTLLGLTDHRGSSHIRIQRTPGPTYQISVPQHVQSAVMIPSERQRSDRAITCLEDLSKELGVNDKYIKEYTSLSGNTMIEKTVGILLNYIRTHYSSMPVCSSDIQKCVFTSNKSYFNESIASNRCPDADNLILYVHGLLKLFEGKLDVKPPYYKTETPSRRHGSRVVNSRPTSAKFPVFEDAEDDSGSVFITKYSTLK